MIFESSFVHHLSLSVSLRSTAALCQRAVDGAAESATLALFSCGKWQSLRTRAGMGWSCLQERI